jgi:hypothetical protein
MSGWWQAMARNSDGLVSWRTRIPMKKCEGLKDNEYMTFEHLEKVPSHLSLYFTLLRLQFTMEESFAKPNHHPEDVNKNMQFLDELWTFTDASGIKFNHDPKTNAWFPEAIIPLTLAYRRSATSSAECLFCGRSR